MSIPSWFPKLSVHLMRDSKEAAPCSAQTGEEYQTDIVPQMKLLAKVHYKRWIMILIVR